MSIRRALAVLRKEFRHIFRDLRLFFLVTVAPAFLLLLLAHVFVLDVQEVELAVWDQDNSPLSRQVLAVLTSDGEFRARFRVEGYDELERLLRSGQADGGLVIPPGLEQEVQAGHPAEIQAVVDGADPIAAIQTTASLSLRIAAISARLSGRSPGSGAIDVRSEVWYNPALDSLVSMVPGLIPIVLCMPALALALALTREKETGSFESLAVTPIRGIEYLTGKLGAYLACGLLGVLPTWLMATLYFRVPFRGSLVLYLLFATAYFLAEMGFSALVANFVRNQQTAMLLVLTLFFVPSFFVAGLILPVDTGNPFSRLVAYSLPTTHFIAISRGVFLKGLGLTPLAFHILVLLAMGLGGVSLSLLVFRKRLG
ncbi:MAG: ABC transporter permease [Anaerolineae bacterium]|nr:ABC transporter permease [Anaerolineae bacterium]MCX8066983.1 ABC transporter permease [Anaerolineae bacterium]MDW7991290.1 ABC transporter permease [Anaerolineae bacterium]